jgi:hypothetical protein
MQRGDVRGSSQAENARPSVGRPAAIGPISDQGEKMACLWEGIIYNAARIDLTSRTHGRAKASWRLGRITPTVRQARCRSVNNAKVTQSSRVSHEISRLLDQRHTPGRICLSQDRVWMADVEVIRQQLPCHRAAAEPR